MDNYLPDKKPEEYCCVEIEEGVTYYHLLKYDFSWNMIMTIMNIVCTKKNFLA